MKARKLMDVAPRAGMDDAAVTADVLLVNKGGTLRYYKTKVVQLVEAVRYARAAADQVTAERERLKKDHQAQVEKLNADIAARAESEAKLRKIVYQVHLMTEE